MQAGKGLSSAPTPFDASKSGLASANHSQPHQHRQSSSVTSLSSDGNGKGSRTSRQDLHHRIRSSRNSNDDVAPTPLRLGRDPMSSEHKRRRSVAIDSSEQRHSVDSTGVSAVNRWSHSTTSSLSSNTRRNRASSGAVLSSLVGQSFSPRQKPLTPLDASPRASPHRRNAPSDAAPLTGSPSRSRRASRTETVSANLTALPPLRTTFALTDPDDTASQSTTQTVVTPPLQPYASNEYFDVNDGVYPYTVAKTQRVTMARNSSAPITVPMQKVASGSDSQETLRHIRTPVIRNQEPRSAIDTSPNSGHGRKSRTRERSEKDKKAMLSKALQKANTAVLLDNAQNYEGAVEAYGDACHLLTQVMERTSGEDDKEKLDAIRVTYSNRMGELRLLVQEAPSASEEKSLPARPMSDDSLAVRSPGIPVSPIDGTVESSSADIPAVAAATGVPRLSYPRNDRDSFFERTMQAVQKSTSLESSSSAPNSYAREHTASGAEHDHHDMRPGQDSLHLPPPEHSQYMPQPLSPKRQQSPTVQSQDVPQERQIEQGGERKPARDREDTADSTSWLDTIDESGSSCSDSVHSVDDLQGVRRKHIRGTSGNTDPDFDAAFDAAVEAAYNEGFEPDLDARSKRLTAMRHAQGDSVQVPASDVSEIVADDFRSASTLNLDPDDEEEERMLEQMTLDYGQGFNFDLQSKSALPRQSDSSGYSRSTWQSSQLSDRATAATSLSTVAEDGLGVRTSRSAGGPILTRARGESGALFPPPTAPPNVALPPPPSAANSSSSVRARRLSILNQKQLKIETSPQPPEARKRASTFHHSASPFAEDDALKSARGRQASFDENVLPTPSDVQHDNILQSPPSLEFHSALDEMSKSPDEEPTVDYRPSYEGMPADLPASRPTLFRKNKSSISLRDHTQHTVLLQSPDQENGPSLITPMSSTFMSFAAAKRNQNPLNSQRANLPSLAQSSFESSQAGGGIHLFDTSLSAMQGPSSPRLSNTPPLPASLEPCPESFLLRPFWLMRGLSQTLSHPRGGFLSTKLCVPREVWHTRGVKLKLIEDKIANCDLLTAALGRLAGVDTYDADAVMDELQSFEEVMERVQAVLAKKLGSDVGVHGVAGILKEASAASMASATGHPNGPESAPSERAAKSNSSKSYLTSWRKLRNKSSGTPPSSGIPHVSARIASEKDQHTMPSVPMTTFVPVERRGNKREARNATFEGPNKEYMGSLARLFDGVQVLDQIARQVEDPGLKHSSPTHVGLELSIRHAAEFFGFYVCRFVLSDLGLLLDKFLKRGSEWVLA